MSYDNCSIHRWILGSLAFVFAQSATSQTIEETFLPKGKGYSGIAVAADGTTYIAEANGSAIAIVKPDGKLIESRTPSANSYPEGVALGSDGNIWFVESDAKNIGVMRPDGFVIHEWYTTCSPSGSIAAGSNNLMWFTERCDDGDFVANVTVAGTMTRFQIGKAADLTRGLDTLIEAADKNIWFAETNGNAIGVLEPSTGLFSEHPTSGAPKSIINGTDGNLWFTDLSSSPELGRIDLHGSVTEFPWPGEQFGPMAIGPDGNLWVLDLTTTNANVWRVQIGASSISPELVISGNPYIDATYMTADPHGNLWFSQWSCGLGRIEMDGIFNDSFDTGACP